MNEGQMNGGAMGGAGALPQSNGVPPMPQPYYGVPGGTMPSQPQSQQPQSPQPQPNSYVAPVPGEMAETSPGAKKKESGWIKFLRVVIWGSVAVAIVIGVGLLGSSRQATSYLDGSAGTKAGWGQGLLWGGVLAGVANLVWGVIRWALRWKREKWGTGKVVGKLIGGGIWRFLAVMPILGITNFFIVPAVGNAMSDAAIAQRKGATTNSMMKLSSAFESGRITADEYVVNLVDSLFRTEKLPKEYRSEVPMIAPDFGEIIAEYKEELSRETVEYVINAVGMNNVRVGVDAGGNIGKENGLRTTIGESVHAATDSVVTLNKALLSNGENVVIFYTDKGEDAIGEAKAVEFAGMFDEIIDNYEIKFGRSFEYERVMISDWEGSGKEELERVLDSNGLDKDLLDRAMPVYVASPYVSGGDGTVAFYAGVGFANVVESYLEHRWDEEGDANRFAFTSPGVPFITVLPEYANDIGELRLTVAHELGHHYADNYCYEFSGEACKTGPFITETAASYFAINVVDDQDREIMGVLSGHHDLFLQYTSCYSVDILIPEPSETQRCHDGGAYDGYPPVAFLQNYAEFVEGGGEKIWEALTYEDSWGYLADAATEEEFREVMVRLSERNLTNDYGDKYTIYARNPPSGVVDFCGMLCKSMYGARYATSRYFYFSAEDNLGKKIKVKARDDDDKIGVLILRQNERGWELVEEDLGQIEYDVVKEDGAGAIALVVTNYSASEDALYYVEVADGEIEGLIAVTVTVPKRDESGEVIGHYNKTVYETSEIEDLAREGAEMSLEGECMSFEIANLLDGVMGIVEQVNGMTGGGLDSDLDSFGEDVQEVKGVEGFGKMTVCMAEFRRDVDFVTARDRAKAILGWSVDFINVNTPDGRTWGAANYDSTRQGINMYMIIDTDGEMTLMSAVTE